MRRFALLTTMLLACTTYDDVTEDTDAGSSSTDPSETSTSTGGASTTGDPTASSTADTSAGNGGSTSGGAGQDELCEENYAQIVFLNFDGATLEAGEADDAPNGITATEELVGEHPAYTGERREDFLVGVRTRLVDFDICVTEQRPANGPFTMLVVSDWIPPDPEDPNGVPFAPAALVDCGNANRNNVALVPDLELMPIGDDPFGDMQTMALSQIGMGLGLEIVTPNDEQVLEVMSGGPTAGATFNDQCIDFAEFPSQECLEQHAAHCPDNQQNSYQELLSVLGPAQ